MRVHSCFVMKVKKKFLPNTSSWDSGDSSMCFDTVEEPFKNKMSTKFYIWTMIFKKKNWEKLVTLIFLK